MIFLLLFACLICSVHGANTTAGNSTSTKPVECVNKFVNLKNTKEKGSLQEICKGPKPCIAKCCSNKYVYLINGRGATCSSVPLKTNSFNYSIDVFDSDLTNLQKTGETVAEHFDFVLNLKLYYPQQSHCRTGVTSKEEDDPYHILKNGSLVKDMKSQFVRFPKTWNVEDYCVEYFVNANSSIKPFIGFLRAPKENFEAHELGWSAKYIAALLLISCFFLILVMAVYGILEELRNLAGMMLMAYAATFFVTFFNKAVLTYGVGSTIITINECKPLSVILYFTSLSGFFWMTVMSFDIWWTFRGDYKCRRIHRQGELMKFLWYALYAWGTPFLVTIVVALLDFLDHDLDIVKMHFENCFYNRGNAKELVYYLHIPMGLLLGLNGILFLLTAFNIWRIKRAFSRVMGKNQESNTTNNKIRLALYLKLALLMGVGWIFELVPMPDNLDIVPSTYNSLLGVGIFIIFVLKRSVLRMLLKRAPANSPFFEKMRRKSSSVPLSSNSLGSRKHSRTVSSNPSEVSNL